MNAKKQPLFFWLHIKKCGGGSIRRALSPWYPLAERLNRPVNFLQSDPCLWNDILNNFRVPLGSYQFRRSAFAKRYLYPDSWDQLLSFAFVRDPEDRIISSFNYLSRPNGAESSFIQYLEKNGHKVPCDTSRKFDLFLDLVHEARNSHSNYLPVNLHFTTHTAAIWDDVTDVKGNVLINHIFRLDALTPALNSVFRHLGLDKRLEGNEKKINPSKSKSELTLSRIQKSRIETLYPNDYGLFESSLTAMV